jgi:hypothetical protein
MTKIEFQKFLIDAEKTGTLLTAKHDSRNQIIMSSYRSVLSPELAENLNEFINSGEYEVTEYENLSSKHPPYYFEICPTNSSYSIPTSGIPANSSTPTQALDRVIAVSGANQAWHLSGESAANIQTKVSQNKLLAKGKLM